MCAPLLSHGFMLDEYGYLVDTAFHAERFASCDDDAYATLDARALGRRC